jgi:5-methylcytosine-specific restriction enzyme A
MKRQEFTTRIKVAAFERSNGRCYECSARLVSAEYHHIIPLAMGGKSTFENCMALCKACHKLKTTLQDVPAIAKAKRIEAKHIGATRPAGKIQSRGFKPQPSNTKQSSVRF